MISEMLKIEGTMKIVMYSYWEEYQHTGCTPCGEIASYSYLSQVLCESINESDGHKLQLRGTGRSISLPEAGDGDEL
jgi:hypothetical protein